MIRLIAKGGFTMKKLFGILFLSCCLLGTTGCMRIYETMTVNPNGTITQTDKVGISKEYLDENNAQPEKGSVLERLEDGKLYYTTTESANVTLKELQSDGTNIILTKDIFYYNTGAQSDSYSSDSNEYNIAQAVAQGIYVKITINLEDNIVDTNANISADTQNNTAAFDTSANSSVWYAYTATGKQLIEKDTTAPTIAGIKNNKIYKTMPKITYSDNVAVAQITLNGVVVTPANRSTYTTSSKGKKTTTTCYDWYGTINGVSKSAKKEGKNVFTVYDIKGNTSSVTFYLDTKAPTIKGIKNNKTYKKQATFYVKDAQNLTKVTINKKKQKLSKKNLIKKGKYKGYYKIKTSKKGKNTIVAYDKAGNKKTIKIKIK